MENIFRIQLNLFGLFTSIIVIALFLKQIKIKNQEDKFFLYISILTLLELVFDSIFWLVDGRVILFGRAVNLIVNCFYYFFQILQSYMWLLYCSVHMGYKTSRMKRMGRRLPLLIGTILLVFNLGTGCVFTVNEENIYQRTWGIGGTMEAVCCLVYPAYAVILTVCKMIRGSKTQRKDGKYLLLVSLVPIISAIIQVTVYGLNFIWSGMSMAMLLIFIEVQSKQYEKMENTLTEQKIQLMLSQIQPHFLYNSLSAIQVLCKQDPEKASDALDDFSRYLRANMDSLGSRVPVSFKQELLHVKHYLNLEKIRFGSSLNVRYDITETQFDLPVLTLQPIVENAVKHGVCNKEEGGTVVLQTSREENDIVIRIQDDGIGFDTSILETMQMTRGERSHIGLINVKSRFESEYGRSMTIDSRVGNGTVVTMRISSAFVSSDQQD